MQSHSATPIMFDEQSAAIALLNLSPVIKQEKKSTEDNSTRISIGDDNTTDEIIPPQTTLVASSSLGSQTTISSYLCPKTVIQYQPPPILNLPSFPNCSATTVTSCDSSFESHHSEWISLESNTRFYEGSVSLSLKEDEESLSPLHCFMRKYCVEAFSATAEDVNTPRYGKSHGRSIVVGQVGIQCMHCKHRPYAQRQERAVCFPSSLKNIYHSIETWQRRHSLVCEDIPSWAKLSMTDLMGKSRSGAGGRRQYWEESAKRLGMVDTKNGIRFIRPPGTLLEAHVPCVRPVQDIPSRPLVIDEDKELVTDFLFTLLDQMETCYFSEQDRVGGRSKVKDCPLGYCGLCCRHCGGKAGFGRYFPISKSALTSANSDRNIFNHIMKCRRCPTDVKEKLNNLLHEQQNSKNRRGNRKYFFQRVWNRMHGQQQVAA